MAGIGRRGRGGTATNGKIEGSLFLILDVFSTAYLLTGSAELALQGTYKGEILTEILKNSMVSMRDGNEFKKAVKDSRLPKELSEWLSLVCSRATNDSEMLLDSWKVQASRSLAKIEDATSLVITFSTLLPVVAASLLLVLGYGHSLLTFSVVFLTIGTYALVSRWMKKLVGPLS